MEVRRVRPSGNPPTLLIKGNNIMQSTTASTSLSQTAVVDDVGKLLLRVALATLLLFHGVSKLSGGIGFVAALTIALLGACRFSPGGVGGLHN
jgi:hypothetical protein